jgi:DNA anti-recombination protein RmuC
MNTIISALVGSGATGLIGWVIMAVRSRRKEKADRIGDLRLDMNQRFTEHREDMNQRFAEHREDMNRQFAEHREEINRQFAEHREEINRQFKEHREDMNRRFDEQKAESDRRFAAVLDEIKGLEHRLTGEIKAQGERIDRVLDVLRNHGERLARIETKLDIDPSA